MDPKILNFISRHRISCLTTLLLDKQPHSATVHYCHQDDPLTFYFLTERASRKCQGLLKGQITKASLVIGFSEEEWVTLQLEGEARALVNQNEDQVARQVFHRKYLGFNPDNLDPEDVFLSFTPTWWRYTELKSNPKLVLSSDK